MWWGDAVFRESVFLEIHSADHLVGLHVDHGHHGHALIGRVEQVLCVGKRNLTGFRWGSLVDPLAQERHLGVVQGLTANLGGMRTTHELGRQLDQQRASGVEGDDRLAVVGACDQRLPGVEAQTLRSVSACVAGCALVPSRTRWTSA